MSKPFFEVFPTLEVKEPMKGLLSETEVTRVSANRSQTSIRIYLFGTHLIPKSDIFRLEKEIAGQLFRTRTMEIKIIEKFQLSGQYAAKDLMEAYGDSIAEELRAYSILLYNVYRSAEISFQDARNMRLVLEDTMLAKERSEELIKILEKIFCERCGMDLMIDVSYAQSKKNSKIKTCRLQLWKFTVWLDNA